MQSHFHKLAARSRKTFLRNAAFFEALAKLPVPKTGLQPFKAQANKLIAKAKLKFVKRSQSVKVREKIPKVKTTS